MATPAMAQEPVFDRDLLDICFENAYLREDQGEEKDLDSCIGVVAEMCMETEGDSSTAGMNKCVGQELDLWDQRLNEIYKDLMVRAKTVDHSYSDQESSPNQASLLKDMQQDWVAFRDSSCAFERSEYHGGSMASNVGIGCLLDMTAKQALVLEGYRDANSDR